MKKQLVIVILLCLFALIVPFTSIATDTTDIYITNAWARPAGPVMMDMDMSDMDMTEEPMGDMDMDMTEEPMGGMNMSDMDMPETFGVSAAYMTIENNSDRAISLVSGVSTYTQVIEIHETNIVDDVMQMRPLEDGIVIEANASVTLQQGGLHIMLVNLLRPLNEGDAVPLTLDFVVLDADGNATDEVLHLVTAVPVVEMPPENSTDYVITGAWARATGVGGMMHDMDMSDMGGMDMEMTEGPMDDMDMTEEPMGDMSDMDMDMMLPPSAVYMNILNRGENDDRLIAVETSVSDVVEIHETNVVDDVMQMREIGVIDLPTGETAVLEQGGFHIMLMGLQQELYLGEAITLTLIFESGNQIVIAVPVLESPMDLMGM